uniref:Saposin B-type domain-containing protein n=1 Tax=Coptotermes formosanus TaxID=36987 RepID=R4V528_COPFO|nr:hypothetical protein [Coptotermes formosanus]
MKATTIKERVVVLKRTLYQIDPKQQQKAERQLQLIDSIIDECTHKIHKCKSQLRKSITVQKFLNEKLKPKKKCGRRADDCSICKKLGRIAKYGIKKNEEDRVILDRLQFKCSKLLPDEQLPCYELAMKVAEKALHTFDPKAFKIHQICRQINACQY